MLILVPTVHNREERLLEEEAETSTAGFGKVVEVVEEEEVTFGTRPNSAFQVPGLTQIPCSRLFANDISPSVRPRSS